ncbi:hypothetical protein [Pedobacter nyackensis]|uniref:hypothetical protein n=1 Tax=Pedobacter nyackensis TaxID=475255 RepID=UPI00292E92C7|nr:hypothetical protein [Pedobacter nyackensis]
MVILYFLFFKTLDQVDINKNIRVSTWLEENDKYLMPCQLEEVLKESDFYSIKVEALDPDNFLSKKYLNRKFLFGHPGKIIGYGILKEIEISH